MIDLIGVPFDHCGRLSGSRMGPITVRLEGLIDALARLGVSVADQGDIVPVDSVRLTSRDEKYAAAVPVYQALSNSVEASCRRNHVPLVLGGDHSLAIGSVSGALRAFGAGLGVLWIDAHMDLNTPETSPSGNLHGMPLAALTRLSSPGSPVWEQILNSIVPVSGLEGSHLAWLGLRDVDQGEVQNLGRLPGAVAMTMKDVDRSGMPGCLDRLRQWIIETGMTHLWVSFDVDSLDPLFAPGTGTAVRGGLTYREGHLIAETLSQWIHEDKIVRLAGLDVVEVNPMQDSHDETAKVAVEWVSSLFGKDILHPIDPGRTEI